MSRKPRSPDPFVPAAVAAAALRLDPRESREITRRFPMRWSRYYLELVDPADPDDPIARMGRPSGAELEADPGDLVDPIADRGKRPVPYLVRKHTDRVILLVTSLCHFYCRFCFRRDEGVGAHREPGPEDLDRALAHVAADPSIEEVILSGGDPLTLGDDSLGRLSRAIAAIPQLKRWRIHTRAPVHFPQRITTALLDAVAGPLPLRFVTHYDHPRELTEASVTSVNRIQDRGHLVLNQTVLLRGVNDDPRVLADLVTGLEAAGIEPYYLHHPDRASGNRSFRLTIDDGLALYRSLRSQLAGRRIPRYVLDLPDGSGKVPVEEFVQSAPHVYMYTHPDGNVSTYVDIPQE